MRAAFACVVKAKATVYLPQHPRCAPDCRDLSIPSAELRSDTRNQTSNWPQHFKKDQDLRTSFKGAPIIASVVTRDCMLFQACASHFLLAHVSKASSSNLSYKKEKHARGDAKASSSAEQEEAEQQRMSPFVPLPSKPLVDINLLKLRPFAFSKLLPLPYFEPKAALESCCRSVKRKQESPAGPQLFTLTLAPLEGSPEGTQRFSKPGNVPPCVQVISDRAVSERGLRVVETLLEAASLSTFVNAWTWPDRTCYPFASPNFKDFYNLLGVYLDSVFRPLVVREPLILRQEGWRFELVAKAEKEEGEVPSPRAAAINCLDTPKACDLTYSGVLYPNVPSYYEDSGGVPELIPNLTLEGLKSFHEPKYNEHPYPSSAGELKDLVTVSWVMNPCRPDGSHEEFDGEMRVAMRILGFLLTGTRSSPLYKALRDSQLGSSEHSPGFDFDTRQPQHAVGPKGESLKKDVRAFSRRCANAKSRSFLELTTAVIAAAAAAEAASQSDVCVLGKWFIARALLTSWQLPSTPEFNLREARRPFLPRGLQLAQLMCQEINFYRDPLEALRFETPLHRLRERVEKGEKVFEDILERYFLENPHRLTLRLKASSTLAAETPAKEQQTLKSLKDSFSHGDLVQIAKEQQAVQRVQTSVCVLGGSLLFPEPRVHLAFFSVELQDGEKFPLDVQTVASVPVLTHELPSSGLIYIDVGLSLSNLSMEDLYYLPLLNSMTCRSLIA
ncbi:hypothetical protein Esti_006770 [Eimeria stiedai]